MFGFLKVSLGRGPTSNHICHEGTKTNQMFQTSICFVLTQISSSLLHNKLLVATKSTFEVQCYLLSKVKIKKSANKDKYSFDYNGSILHLGPSSDC